MVITPDFVFIFFPKTATTFTRDVLLQLFKQKGYPYFQCPTIKLESKYMASKEISIHHGRIEQIPPEHIHKPIVSIMRNPYEGYVSRYLFQAWARHPEYFHKELLYEEYPLFPDISFEEYIHLINNWKINLNRPEFIPPNLGALSHQFIQFYFKNPDETIARYDSDYVINKTWVSDIAPILFLRTENLREDLIAFLSGKGFKFQSLEFIRQAEKKRESLKREGPYHVYFTEDIKKYILSRESIIFDIFPEYAG